MSLKDHFVSALEFLPVTIASGSALSGAINLAGLRLAAIVMPSAWTTANITFQISPDAGTTWCDLKDQNGNEITAVASASSCIILTLTQFSSVQYLRIRSGTSATPVNQAATRALQLVLRSV